MPAPPAGFVLDEPVMSSTIPPPPPGFQLDVPEKRLSTAKVLAQPRALVDEGKDVPRPIPVQESNTPAFGATPDIGSMNFVFNPSPSGQKEAPSQPMTAERVAATAEAGIHSIQQGLGEGLIAGPLHGIGQAVQANQQRTVNETLDMMDRIDSGLPPFSPGVPVPQSQLYVIANYKRGSPEVRAQMRSGLTAQAVHAAPVNLETPIEPPNQVSPWTMPAYQPPRPLSTRINVETPALAANQPFEAPTGIGGADQQPRAPVENVGGESTVRLPIYQMEGVGEAASRPKGRAPNPSGMQANMQMSATRPIDERDVQGAQGPAPEETPDLSALIEGFNPKQPFYVAPSQLAQDAGQRSTARLPGFPTAPFGEATPEGMALPTASQGRQLARERANLTGAVTRGLGAEDINAPRAQQPENAPNLAMRAADAVTKFTKEQFPVAKEQEGTFTRVMHGIGNLGGLVLGGAAGTVVAGPAGGMAVIGPSIAASSYDSTFKDARARGATVAQANDAAIKDAAVQTAIMTGPVGRLFRNLPELKEPFIGTVINLSKHGIEFGSLSALGAFAHNFVAKSTYNPNQYLSEGVTDALLEGTLMGVAMPAVGALFRRAAAEAPPIGTPAWSAWMRAGLPPDQARLAAPGARPAAGPEAAPEPPRSGPRPAAAPAEPTQAFRDIQEAMPEMFPDAERPAEPRAAEAREEVIPPPPPGFEMEQRPLGLPAPEAPKQRGKAPSPATEEPLVTPAPRVEPRGTASNPVIRDETVTVGDQEFRIVREEGPHPNAPPTYRALDGVGNIVAAGANRAEVEDNLQSHVEAKQRIAETQGLQHTPVAEAPRVPEVPLETAESEIPAATSAPPPSVESPPPESTRGAPEIVEHVTAKGKTLRGVVRTDLTQAQAKAIDKFTFKKTDASGRQGWFIREANLPAAEQPKAPEASNAAEVSKPAETGAPKPPISESGHFAAGWSDRLAGRPRVLPSYFTDTKNKNAKDWLRGWDAAPVEKAAETPKAPEQPAPEAPEPKAEQPKAEIKPDHALAEHVADAIADPRKELTARSVQQEADRIYGGTLASGAYTRDRLYDAIELGVNRHIQRNPEQFSPLGDAAHAHAAIDDLRAMKDRMPTQTVRAGEKDTHQQFSTPPDYSYAAAWVAGMRPGEVVLEPSAGTGSLAVHAMNAGAKEVYGNEISPKRRAMLEALGFDKITAEDAAHLHNALPSDIRPTVVLMNPPFSAAAGRMGDKMVLGEGARHVEQALARLEPGGRLVAIVGRGMAPDAASFKDWWRKIGAQYDVRANLGVGGAIYRKYGTTFPTRLLVIDKVPPSGRDIVRGDVETADQIVDALEGIRNDRPPVGASERPTDQPSVPVVAPEGKGPGGPTGVVSGPVGGVGAGKRPDRPAAERPEPAEPAQPGDSGERPPVERPEAGSAGDKVAGVKPEPEPARTDEQPVAVAGPSEVAPGSSPGGGGVGIRPDGSGERDVPGVTPAPESVIKTEDAVTEPDDTALTESVYEAYKPQRIQIKGAKAHPGALVQSAAMASVLPPKPTYSPKLPQALITSGALSDAQLEAIVYAGNAHSEMLPAAGEETPFRRGFFIGDGTGVGKGREIAGIILDNFQQGRKKAVWVSEKKPLINDAKRDWSGLSQPPTDIIDHGATKAGDEIKAGKGILFTTYDTMKSAEQVKQGGEKARGKERVQQIAEWLGPDFDGVIVFDEAHNLGNSMDVLGGRGVKKAAAKALAGVELQRILPNARVVYVSATGATEVSNLAYADRVGLWGKGTAFANKGDFLSKISSGGIAAMELVARDMKALGHYVARNLSYDGVEYSRLEHKLSKEQRNTYDKMAEGWQVVLQNFQAALAATGAAQNSQRKSAVLSAFWGAHQRFFNQIITSMQMPTVLRSIEKDIKEGRQAVIQLVSTMEAAQERALGKVQEGDDLEDLDMTPRDQLMNMVENAFPVQEFEEYVDENGNTRTRPVVDSAGNPVVNKEMVAAREKLLDQLGSLKVPDGPLEMLLNHFGTDKVAEVTGRKQRVVKKPDENGMMKTVVEKRPGSANVVEANAFQDAKKPILVFSAAGGTGRSYHADINSASAKARRSHYLAQPGWRADAAVQGFGRTHRTNQKSAPIFHLVTTDLQGQKRFISSIARRLAQLGALTKGERRTGDQGLFGLKDNLESDEARAALVQFFKDVHRGEVEGITIADLERGMGLRLLDTSTGGLRSDLPGMAQFLNRLLSLKIDEQNATFNAFAQRFDDAIDRAAASGTLDTGVETYRADRIVKKGDQVVYTDPHSGAETRHVHLEAQNRNRPASFEDVAAGKAKTAGRKPRAYVQNNRSGRIFAVTEATAFTNKDGDIVEQYRLTSPLDYQLVERRRINRDNWTRIDDVEEARKLWDQQVEQIPEFSSSDLHLITGAVLPIWDRLGGSPRIYRLQTADGERLLGRVVDNRSIAATLESLGAEKLKVTATPAEIAKRVLAGDVARMANGWTIKRSLVAGEPRLELTGPDFSYDDQLKKEGVFSERIAYQTRYFIPTGEDAGKIIAAITETRPITQLGSERGAETPSFGRRGDVTQTPAFKAWFKDSKVVGTGGKPLVVYHGTSGDIKAFDPRLVRMRDHGFLGRGYSFSTDPDRASAYAESAGETPNVNPVYLSIQNPYRAELGEKVPPRDELEARGHDGVIMDLGADPWAKLEKRAPKPNELEILAFRPEQIKSATGNRGTFDPTDPRIAFGRKLPFYSAVERAVGALKQEKGTGEQMLSAITKTPGVKAEEMRYLGLSDWLRGQKSVTKADIIDYVRANALDVHEVVKGDSTKYDDLQTEQELAQFALTNALPPEGLRIAENQDPGARVFQMSPREIANELATAPEDGGLVPDDLPERYRDMASRIYWAAHALRRPEGEGTAKFASYQLPGGTGYREVVLTLPVKRVHGAIPTEQEWLERQPWHRPGAEPSNRDLALYDEWLQREHQGRDAPSTYRSPHWDEPNVLAHVRFNERTAPDGKRVLLIEESQSDWHQKGRKGGYQTPESERLGQPLKAEDKNGYWEVRTEDGQFVTNVMKHEGFDTAESATAEAQRRLAENSPFSVGADERVPDAPFKTSWPALIQKRMIQFAVDNGFDRVAWVPGDVQNARYDLSKHIDRIVLRDNSSGGVGRPNMEGPFKRGILEAYDLSGRQVVSDKSVTPDMLPDIIGKEAADKLLAVEPTEGRDAGIGVRLRTLKNADLKIGGEGQRGFYDRILPAETQKIVGKFGAKVGKSEIVTEDPDGAFVTQDVHSFDVTEALRKAVTSEGLPLFERHAEGMASPDAYPDMDAIQAVIDEAARITGGKVRIEAYDPEHHYFTVRHPDGTTQRVYGYAMGRLIRIAVESNRGDFRKNLTHEALHGLRNLGVFTDAEWRTLEATAKREGWVKKHGVDELYADHGETDQIEEAIAEEFARGEKPKPGTFMARMLDKLRQFFERLRNLLAKRGFQTAADVFERARSGEVGKREPGSGMVEKGPTTVRESVEAAQAWFDSGAAAAGRRKEKATDGSNSDRPAEPVLYDEGMARLLEAHAGSPEGVSRVPGRPGGETPDTEDSEGTVGAKPSGGVTLGSGRPQTFDLDYRKDQRGDRQIEIGDTLIEYTPRPDGKTVDVERVHTSDEGRGVGSARAAMEQLIAEADRGGKRLELISQPDEAGVSQRRLDAFYRSLGFERQRGGNSVFVREPQKPGNEPVTPAFGRRRKGTTPEEEITEARRRFLAKAEPGPIERATAAAMDKVSAPIKAAMASDGAQKLMSGQDFESLADKARALGRNVGMLVDPIALGSERAQAAAKEFANTLRRIDYHLKRLDDALKIAHTPKDRALMGSALDEQSVFDQGVREQTDAMRADVQAKADEMRADGATYGDISAFKAAEERKIKDFDAQEQADYAASGKGLARLNPKQRADVDMLSLMADKAWTMMQKAGIVDGRGLPHYMPRYFVNLSKTTGDVSKIRSGEGRPPAMDPIGGNLRTAGPGRRHHLTPEETVAAAKAKLGDEAELVTDIRALVSALQQSQRAVAGRNLVDAIREIGRKAGVETVADGPRPDFFSLDHPALSEWRPTFKTDEEGNVVIRRDEDGRPIFEQRPIYVAREFEGPLRSVLSKPPSALYNAVMQVKSLGVSIIMASPMTHNMVIYGKAFPLMPGKMLTLQLYRDGHMVRTGLTYKQAVKNWREPGAEQPKDSKHTVFMNKMIQAGMVPINGGWLQDVTGIAAEVGGAPGKSIPSKVIGAAVGALAGKDAKYATRNAIDAAGDFWHGTLLWERIADLQAGIAHVFYERMLQAGLTDREAALVAAHIANRFAGVVPNESTSTMLRRIENLVLFSRQFTLGNLGIMRDVLQGLPSDIRAQFSEEGGETASKAAKSVARKIAIATFIKDFALFYGANALVQMGIQAIKQYFDDPDDDVFSKLGKRVRAEVDGLLRRLAAMAERRNEHPLNWVDPRNVLTIPEELSPLFENEPGKQERIFVGLDHNGRGIYIRNPFGKVGEEFKNWLTRPLTQFKNKLSPMVRPLADIAANSDGFGRAIYDVDAHEGLSNNLSAIGDSIAHYASAQVPLAMLQGGYDYVTGAPNPEMSLSKSVLPFFTGITVSQGDPMGPEGGVMRGVAKRSEQEFLKKFPKVKQAMERGDEEEAARLLSELGERPSEIRAHLRNLAAPERRASPKGYYGRQFEEHAKPSERERLEHVTR